MTEKTDTSASIVPFGQRSSGSKTASSPLKYIPPGTSENHSAFYQLPPLQTIYDDFKLCAGSWNKFLRQHITDENHHNVVLTEILALIETAETETKESFELVRRMGEQALLMRVEDDMHELAGSVGKERVSAMKWLLEKRMPDKFGKSPTITAGADPLDEHLNEASSDGK